MINTLPECLCCGNNFSGIVFLLFTEAVRRNIRTAGATDDDIREEVVRYLHGSSDRDGGRAKRQKKRHQAVMLPRNDERESD